MDNVVPDWPIAESVLQKHSVRNITAAVGVSTGIRPGPLLFLLCKAINLFDVIAERSFSDHSFADDS